MNHTYFVPMPTIFYLLTILIISCGKKNTVSKTTFSEPNSTQNISMQLLHQYQIEGIPIDTNFIIIPGQRIGKINKNTSKAELLEILPASKFIKTLENNVLMYNYDFYNKVYFHFTDNNLKNIEKVIIEGTLMPWSTPEGLFVGINTERINSINKNAFEISGIAGYLQGGEIINWNNGTLNKYNKTLKNTMTFDGTDELSAVTIGNKLEENSFISTDPTLGDIHLYIYQMIVYF